MHGSINISETITIGGNLFNFTLDEIL